MIVLDTYSIISFKYILVFMWLKTSKKKWKSIKINLLSYNFCRSVLLAKEKLIERKAINIINYFQAHSLIHVQNFVWQHIFFPYSQLHWHKSVPDKFMVLQEKQFNEKSIWNWNLTITTLASDYSWNTILVGSNYQI